MNRRILLIGIGGTLAVLLLWYVVLWGPRSKAIVDARERTTLAEQKQDDLLVRIARLKAAQRDEPAKRALVETLRAAVPDEPNLAQFILDTNDAATKSGLDFLSIAPTQPASGAPNAPAAINLTMSVSGGYFQVLDFLNRLASMPRIVVVREINLGGRAETGRLNVSVTANMYTSGGESGPLGSPSGTTTTTVAGSGATTSTTAVGQ